MVAGLPLQVGGAWPGGVGAGVCAAVCAPSAITPTAATPITTANRLPISCFFFVLAHISGLLRVVASGLPTSRGPGACLTARSLRHGGTFSVHLGRARRGLGVRRREPSARRSAERDCLDVLLRHRLRRYLAAEHCF